MTVAEFCEQTDTWYAGCPAKEGDCCNAFTASCLACSEGSSTKKFCAGSALIVSGCRSSSSSVISPQEGGIRMKYDWEDDVQTTVESFPHVIDSVRVATLHDDAEAQEAAGRVAYGSVLNMMDAGATIEEITVVGVEDDRSWMLDVGGMDYGFHVIGEDYDHASDDLIACQKDCQKNFFAAEASAMAT